MKGDRPNVSVIIPYFNAEKTLKRAARSILEQTYTNFELLLVNNNSTDNSEDIALLLSNEDHRIKLLSETRQGVTFAANTGNSAATGKYIARMDADDFSHPQRLEKQVALLENHAQIDVASCLANHVGHHKNTNGLKQFVEWTNTLQTPAEINLNRFIESPIVNPTVLLRKELIAKHGGYKHGNFPEDYELWLRWIEQGVRIKKVPEVLFDWHDSDTRLTRTDKHYSSDAFFQTKAEYLSKWLFENNHPYVWIWGAGRVTRKRVEMLQNKGIFIEGYIDIRKREIKHSLCVHFDNFNWNAPSFIVSYVANWGARNEIRNYLTSKGKIEGVNFILVV